MRIDALGRPSRAVAAMIAAVCGALLGAIAFSADLVALLWAILVAAAILGLAARAIEPAHRRSVLLLAAFALGLHVAVALVLHELAVGFGTGFITGDDASYFRLSSALASYWGGHPAVAGYGPPLWGGDAYLLGAFVYLEAGVFMIFGPDVRLALISNAGLAIVTALLSYAGAVRLFGHRAGLVTFIAVAFFPSLILWSALNLKDSLTIALAVFAIWAIIEYRSRPHLFLPLAAFVAAEGLITLRSYVAATIAIACLLALALVGVPVARRVASVATAGALTAIILLQSLNAVGSSIGQQLLVALERERAAMAVGARTGFIATATPPTTPSSAPTPSQPAASSSAGPTPPATQAATASAPTPPVAPADELAVAPGRTLAYLPTGMAYAIFAPVPFTSTRLQELLTAPEMLLWYVLVVSGIFTIWRDRQRWRSLAPLVLSIAGLMAVLALAEGNVGTLFRHRGMVVPFAAILASPTVLAAITWLRRSGWKDTTDAPAV
jgi:hypothetical protein